MKNHGNYQFSHEVPIESPVGKIRTSVTNKATNCGYQIVL